MIVGDRSARFWIYATQAGEERLEIRAWVFDQASTSDRGCRSSSPLTISELELAREACEQWEGLDLHTIQEERVVTTPAEAAMFKYKIKWRPEEEKA